MIHILLLTLLLPSFKTTCQPPCELSALLIINNAIPCHNLWRLAEGHNGIKMTLYSLFFFFFLLNQTTKWPQYINKSWRSCWSMEENFLPLRLSLLVCFCCVKWIISSRNCKPSNELLIIGKEVRLQAGTHREERFNFESSNLGQLG